MSRKTKIIMAIIAAAVAVAGVIVYAKAVKPLPPDNAQLTEIKFYNLMGSRYTEILLVFGNAMKHEFMAGVYNTVGLNGANPAGGGNSCPAVMTRSASLRSRTAWKPSGRPPPGGK